MIWQEVSLDALFVYDNRANAACAHTEPYARQPRRAQALPPRSATV